MTREEAIQMLSTRDAHGVLCGYTSGIAEALDMAIETLSEDKTDRPKGEWIVDAYNMELRCGICGETFRFDDVDEVLDYMEYAKYCLACGAKMGGDTE